MCYIVDVNDSVVVYFDLSFMLTSWKDHWVCNFISFFFIPDMAYDMYEKDGDTGDKWVWEMLASKRKFLLYSIFIVDYEWSLFLLRLSCVTRKSERNLAAQNPWGGSARKEGQPTKPASLNHALLGVALLSRSSRPRISRGHFVLEVYPRSRSTH